LDLHDAQPDLLPEWDEDVTLAFVTALRDLIEEGDLAVIDDYVASYDKVLVMGDPPPGSRHDYSALLTLPGDLVDLVWLKDLMIVACAVEVWRTQGRWPFIGPRKEVHDLWRMFPEYERVCRLLADHIHESARHLLPEHLRP
jgi:hypothetical protein